MTQSLNTPEIDHNSENGPVEVTVRTPAGFAQVFKINLQQKVHVLLDEAVRAFIKSQQLQPGGYRLVDISDGTARALTDTARLGESGVNEGSLLSLQSTDPQVDG
jgi:hypothetical protein